MWIQLWMEILWLMIFLLPIFWHGNAIQRSISRDNLYHQLFLFLKKDSVFLKDKIFPHVFVSEQPFPDWGIEVQEMNSYLLPWMVLTRVCRVCCSWFLLRPPGRTLWWCVVVCRPAIYLLWSIWGLSAVHRHDKILRYWACNWIFIRIYTTSFAENEGSLFPGYLCIW